MSEPKYSKLFGNKEQMNGRIYNTLYGAEMNGIRWGGTTKTSWTTGVQYIVNQS